MTKILLNLILSISFISIPAPAEDAAPNQETQLSAAGLRRLEENKQIVLKNIEMAKTNVENCQNNVATLEKQLEEVSKIESELFKLKEQYETFVKNAETESRKNHEALAKLTNAKDRKLAAVEQTEREAWSKDTSEKIAKVRGLLQRLKKDMEGVHFQKNDLVAQKNHWVEREKYHQRMVEELTVKKTEAEKKLKGDS